MNDRANGKTMLILDTEWSFDDVSFDHNSIAMHTPQLFRKAKINNAYVLQNLGFYDQQSLVIGQVR